MGVTKTNIKGMRYNNSQGNITKSEEVHKHAKETARRERKLREHQDLV